MSGAPRRWIRLDVGWAESEWLVAISPLAQLAWVRLLCYAKLSGKFGRVKVLGPAAVRKLWGVPRSDLAAMLEAAQAGEDPALEVTTGEWFVTAWDRYQEPDRTRAERQAKFRERNGSNAVTPQGNAVSLSRDHRPLTEDPRPKTDTSKATSTPSPTSSAVGVAPGTALSVGTNGKGDPALWMHAVWQEELGSRIPLGMTDERRQKYRAMYTENLSASSEPETAWRLVLWAVKQSDFHMGNRDYQMPESLLKSKNSRSKWLQKTVAVIDQQSQQERDAEKIREHLRRRES